MRLFLCVCESRQRDLGRMMKNKIATQMAWIYGPVMEVNWLFNKSCTRLLDLQNKTTIYTWTNWVCSAPKTIGLTGLWVFPFDAIAGSAGEVTPGVHHKAMSAGISAIWNEVQHTATHPWRNITNINSYWRLNSLKVGLGLILTYIFF